MLKIVLIIALFVLWFITITQDALKGPMSGAIEAMKDGYNIGMGILCIFIRFGIPVLLVIWLIF